MNSVFCVKVLIYLVSNRVISEIMYSDDNDQLPVHCLLLIFYSDKPLFYFILFCSIGL